jgi:hypothetical protein
MGNGSVRLVFAAVVTLAVVVAGCSSANHSASSSTSSMVSAPTSTTVPATTIPTATTVPASPPLDWSLNAEPYPADVLDAAYTGVCAGHAVATAAAYAGASHPLAIIGGLGNPYADWESELEDTGYNGNNGGDWPAEMKPASVESVQLVACVSTQQVADKSCGFYTRQSDGVSGELRLTNGVTTIKIVVARTGAVIAQKVYTATPLSCNNEEPAASGNPPWVIANDPPGLTDGQPICEDYIIGFTQGPAQ